MKSQSKKNPQFFTLCTISKIDIEMAQCENSRVLLSLRFYVKSNLAILRGQKLQFQRFLEALKFGF